MLAFLFLLFFAYDFLKVYATEWRRWGRSDRLYVAAHAGICVGLPLLAGALLLAGD
jgi:hypothetical protein